MVSLTTRKKKALVLWTSANVRRDVLGKGKSSNVNQRRKAIGSRPDLTGIDAL